MLHLTRTGQARRRTSCLMSLKLRLLLRRLYLCKSTFFYANGKLTAQQLVNMLRPGLLPRGQKYVLSG